MDLGLPTSVGFPNHSKSAQVRLVKYACHGLAVPRMDIPSQVLRGVASGPYNEGQHRAEAVPAQRRHQGSRRSVA